MVYFLLLIIIFCTNLSYYLLYDLDIGFINDKPKALYNFALFEQNYLTLLLFVTWVLQLIPFLKRKYLRLIIVLIPLSIMTILIVDNCILNTLNTRLNFSMIGQAGDVGYIGDFVKKYIYSVSGQFMVTAYILTLGLIFYCLCIKQRKSSKFYFSCYSFITVVAIVLSFFSFEKEEPNFLLFNPLQVNGICLYSYGNFYKEYTDDYEPRKKLNIEWKTDEGLNRKQNVIVILVESWGSALTSFGGNTRTFTPNLEKIAHDNLFFDNYYSVMPSTSMAALSIIKSTPTIQSAWKLPINSFSEDGEKNSVDKSHFDDLYTRNDLINTFKINGYKTRFISSSKLLFKMDMVAEASDYDEVIDSNSSIFNSFKKEYFFKSVHDEILFSLILDLIKKEKGCYFYVTKTINTHSPYNSPLGKANMRKAFEYTDKEIDKFISNLYEIGYFQNGIVVLVGDHHPWNGDFSVASADDEKKYGKTWINKVPMIIVDGKHKPSVIHTELSHASLGVILQYLELPTYKYNQFNVNPLVNENSSEIIFAYNFNKMSQLIVRYKDTECSVQLNGNETRFLDCSLSEDDKNLILGYISYFRR